ncbi:MAG: L,D-transpeptidase [Clostridia bacterium]|nr:L,D-transpeptidase [Clostridia bacterium]
MKKTSEKTKNIIKCTIIGILLIILVYMVVNLTGKFSNRSVAVETVNPVEFEQEEIKDIEDLNVLEENVLEKEQEKIQDDKSEKSNDNNKKKKVNSDKPYYIKVNYGANVVTVYSKDENGDYTVPVKAMVCSTGRATPTSGTYTIKGRWRWLKMIGGVYAQYTTQVVGNILFHSVPYLRKGDSSSLEYWEYDKLGTRASAGCIRLTMQDASWIYNNIASGTLVEFYSSSDPGPLGKPSAPKISWNEECRGWDPTDSDPNNPWRNYQQNIVVEENLNNNSNDNNLDNSNNIDNTNNNIDNSGNVDDNVNNEINKDNNTIEDDNKENEKTEEENKNNSIEEENYNDNEQTNQYNNDIDKNNE